LEAEVIAEFRSAKAKAKKNDKLTKEQQEEAEAKAAAARVAKVQEAKRLAELAKMTPEQLAAQAAADLEAKRQYELRRRQEDFTAAMLTLADQSEEALRDALMSINAELKARKKVSIKKAA
jgi:hypothetical protein